MTTFNKTFPINTKKGWMCILVISIMLSSGVRCMHLSGNRDVIFVSTDTDVDGILDDGDNSGIILDNPCTGGETIGCDDNCLLIYNPKQVDLDSDGVGDTCECEADFDGDGDVDGIDVVTFLKEFRRSIRNRPCTPEDPCNCDLNRDGSVDSYDNIKFNEDFGRNKWNNPCPPCCFGLIETEDPSPVDPLPSPRFIDYGDGTVTDKLTGLMWTENAQQISGKKNWRTAITLCNGLIYPETDGYDDWRLPSLKELQSLIDYGNYPSTLPSGHPFQNVLPFLYWTSTSYETISNHACYILMPGGPSYYHCKTAYGYVWPVRGGQ